ncbi:MAG TPA: DapH/DapD/GlmU-related protein [Candidatus Deferrimicrobium sp.]|nr:DapH/DapD/GlmU-related protein [Candidatus Deferrimicrobium sp.]
MSEKNYFVHESSYVDDNVEIGEGTKIWHFSHIQGGTRIGKKCSLGQNVNVANNVIIGDNVKIQNNVSVYEGVELEDYVFCGPSMVFTNILNPRSEFPQRGAEYYIKTLVKKSASLGANSTIVCGHTIGKYAFVAAGGVVTKDVPDYALVMGNPARLKAWYCACGAKLGLTVDPKSEETGVCPKCQRKYKKSGFNVEQIEN